MRILFAGGTGFVGRAMAVEALQRGHQVSLLHRGKHEPVELAAAEHLLADRDGDLSILDGREFDATIDVCAYVPRQVDHLAEALGGRGGHHAYISTMSVYQEPDGPGLDESGVLATLDDPTTEDVTGETYGGLKVLCEQRAQAAYEATGLTIIRPTYVIGPHDPTGRFTWWVRRISRGGQILAPGPTDAPMQTIDARDQATWTLDLVERGESGAFNSTSMPFDFRTMLYSIVDAVGPQGTELTWVDGAWLVEQGENYASFPLWAEGAIEWSLAAEPVAALASGLTTRPLVETARDTLAWMQAELEDDAPAGGVSAEREAELLAAADK